MKKFMALGAIAAIVATNSASAGVFDTLEFEDLIAGSSFNTGSSFVTDGVTVELEEFFWLPNGSTLNGFAEVINPNQAGGGNGIFANNTNLNFQFLFPQSVIGFAYANEGGNVNLIINGTLLNADTLLELDGTVADGVSISIAPSIPGEDRGFLTLQGDISSFAVGGQEFNIDDVRYIIPSPGTIAVLGLFGIAAIRRRR